jgi:hypothetical protein
MKLRTGFQEYWAVTYVLGDYTVKPWLSVLYWRNGAGILFAGRMESFPYARGINESVRKKTI